MHSTSSSTLSRRQRPKSNDNGKFISTEEEVKLAALAISLNVRLRSADMPFTMQEHALRYTRTLLLHPSPHRPNPTLLARFLKKVGLLHYLFSSCSPLVSNSSSNILNFFFSHCGFRSLIRYTDQRGTVWWERVSDRL